MADNKIEINSGTTIEQVDTSNIIDQYFLGYAAYTISDRAIPQIEDGLKPVQRRVLYTMNDLCLHYNKPTKKSAKVTGACLGSYHPHNDTSVYDAMINMAQEWKKRYPLVYIQGNVGTIDGDPPAAQRYTEAKLTKLGEYMMNDINKNTVQMIPTYDESSVEPVVLPTLFINILCNGIIGTATGIATSMAPHYAGDVYKAIDYIIECAINKKNPDIDHVIDIIKAPDFPTGGIITNPDDMSDMYKTGSGKVIIRGVCKIDNDNIIVKELPYMVNKAKLVADIGRVCLSESAAIEGVKDVNDESNKDGIRIVIKLKKGANPATILNNLYKKTDLQSSFSVYNTVIINKRPREKCNLSTILTLFIRHACNIIKRKAQYEYNEYTKRKHIVEGYLNAINKIDAIIRSIRSAKSYEEKLNNVIIQGFDEVQAKAIIAMSIGSISNIDEDKYIHENEKLINDIDRTYAIVHDNNVLLKTCRNVLHDFATSDILKNDKRRTQIVYGMDTSISDRELIDDEDVVITYSHNGIIKSVKVDEYNTQRRNGKGVTLRTREDDFIEKILTVSSKDNLLLFTQSGRCYTLPIYKIPIVSKNSVGKYIVNYIDLAEGDSIKSVISVHPENTKSSLVLITKLGNIKKMSIQNACSKFKSTKVVEFRDNDMLVGAYLTDENDNIIVATKAGKGLRVDLSKIRQIGAKSSPGIKLIKLTNGDEVIGAISIKQGDGTICIITKRGLGKRIATKTMTVHGRGTSGQRMISLAAKDEVASIAYTHKSETLLLVTSGGMITRTPVDDISHVGLQAKGVKVMNLNEEDYIISISVAPEQQKEESNKNSKEAQEGIANTNE